MHHETASVIKGHSWYFGVLLVTCLVLFADVSFKITKSLIYKLVRMHTTIVVFREINETFFVLVTSGKSRYFFRK